MEDVLQGAVKGKIRKVTAGVNPMQAKAVTVGTELGSLQSKIVEIVQDKNHLVRYGVEKFLVIIENKEGNRYVWNEITGLPTVVEYFDPKGEAVNIN